MRTPLLMLSLSAPGVPEPIARFSLVLEVERGILDVMRIPPGQTRDGTDAGLSSRPNSLEQAVEAWLAHLGARGRRARTVASFRQVVSRAARERSWTDPGDLTFEAIAGYLGAMRRASWSCTTYNRNLSCFKSLTRYLAVARQIPSDPLLDAPRAVDDGGAGSRAATVEEARALVLQAWVRDRADRRCKGNRALYWMCLFAHGCRFAEPGLWQRRHLVLDAEVPHVLWTKDIQKSRRLQEVALAPELVTLLRAHVAALDRARDAAGFPPAGPEEPVFPVRPTRASFRADRGAAGIPEQDRRARGFSPHSARKWFATAMTGAGVAEKMVDRLMRHSGRVEHRYYDPPLAEQAEALARLPRLWPSTSEGGQPVDNARRLTEWPQPSDSPDAGPMRPPSRNSARTAGAANGSSGLHSTISGAPALPAELPSPHRAKPPGSGQELVTGPGMPRAGLEPATCGL